MSVVTNVESKWVVKGMDQPRRWRTDHREDGGEEGKSK